jgi:hypothetical protein
MKIGLIIHLMLLLQIAFASVDSLAPKNNLTLDLAYQYYFHKGNFIAQDVYDKNGNQINTNTYAPSIAQNKGGFSFGLAYSRFFFKPRRFFVQAGLGYGQLNYGLGFKMPLDSFWNIPSLQGKIADTIYQLKYPYLYGDFRLGYRFPIGKNVELNFWAGYKLHQLLTQYNIQQKVVVYTSHNGSSYIFDNIGTSVILQTYFPLLHAYRFGGSFSFLLFQKRVQFSTSLLHSIHYDKTVGLARFNYKRVSNFDPNSSTDKFTIELSGSDVFTYRIRALELSLSIGF